MFNVLHNYAISFLFDKLYRDGKIKKVLYLFPLSIRISDFETQFLDEDDKLLFIRDCLIEYHNTNSIENIKSNKKDFVLMKKDGHNSLKDIKNKFNDYLIQDFNSCKSFILLNYLVGHFINIIDTYIPFEIIEDEDLFLEKTRIFKRNKIDLSGMVYEDFNSFLIE